MSHLRLPLLPLLLLSVACGSGTEPTGLKARLPAAPQPWLAVDGVARLGEPMRMVLRDAPRGAQSDPLVLRNGSAQWNELRPLADATDRRFEFVPESGGHAVAAMTIRVPDPLAAQTLYIKTVFSVLGEPPRGSAALVTAAIGQPLELVPLVDPHVVMPGDELPVRVRADDGDVADLELRIDRQEQEAWITVGALRSGERGLCVVRLEQAGWHRLVLSRPHDFERAQLTFEVGGGR